MKLFETLDRISYLNLLIKNGKTGTPANLAKSLGISRSTLYKMIEELKSLDAPIRYSRTKETFYYTKEFDLKLSYSLHFIEDDIELIKITGGFNISPSVSFLGRRNVNFTLV